jgi:two-component system, chemotaxis family, CheB/CheR fusion protein
MPKKVLKKSAKTKVARTITSAKEQRNQRHDRLTFPIVAIGASAGGVEASTQLLDFLPPGLGMAYIFVHHLSPDYDSHLTDILQRHTSMRVIMVTDRMRVEPDHVYVIPPDQFMIIADGHLFLRKRTKKDVHSIDHFMHTLASVYQHNAIGILLSGTASDGTLGLKEIKLGGGLTFAQDESAMHSEMPSHAADAGFVDYVLPPKRIAEELGAMIRHRFSVTSANEELAKHEKEIKKILSIVLEKFDVDFFSHYKRTTVNRRILRRMTINNIDSFEGYAKKLRTDNKELDALYNDFLINVTSFFREPNFYAGLKKFVFPHIIKDRAAAEPIRVWVPGCATGEEAYSTAITITEFLRAKKLSMPVQIFATDLDEKAIAKARLGIYSKNAVSSIEPSRIEKFFTKIDGHYQIDKVIRDMCVFSVHNLMKDPPFSRIDLVSCQNVLIYIEAAPQRKILQAFHYSLKPTGFLILGKSETIGNAVDLFEQVGKELKLYRKKHLSKVSALDFFMRSAVTPTVSKLVPEQRTVADVEQESDKILLTRYVPASVLVNRDLEILRFRGPVNAFFQPASGKASLNLLKMLKDDLIFEMRSLFQKVRKSNGPVLKEGITVESTNQVISIEIAPLKTGNELYYLVVFQTQAMPQPKSTNVRVKKGDQMARISKLEQALKDARTQLRVTTEDFDVAKEELQSANEEILSSNEELQSINEELETSKEELQSANEELTTINEELQNRVEELRESRDYIRAIIETMHGPLLVLNNQEKVRTANRSFYEFFRLRQEETEGRFIHALAHGKWHIPALGTQLQDMMQGGAKFKNFEVAHEFPGVGNRTMVINAHLLTNPDNGNQILLAFQDVTQFRENEKKLREAQQQLKLALEGGSVGTWTWDLSSNALTASREQALIFGFERGEFFKSYDDWLTALHRDDVAGVKEAIRQSITHKKPLDIEFRIVHPNGRVRWVLSKANTFYGVLGEPEVMMGVNIDVTERRLAIEALAESEKRFHTLSDQAPVMIWMTDDQQRCNFVNKTWLEFTGKTVEQEIGMGWYESIHPDDKQIFLDIYNEAYRERKEFKADYRLRRHDREYRWILAHGVPRYTNRDTFIGYIGTCIDITDRIELEKQKDDFMGIASHELKTPVTSIKAYAQILHEKFRKANDTVNTEMLGRLDSQIDKLTNLINTLLDVARIQSGQMEYDADYFDVASFVQEITEEMQRTTPNHKITVDIDVPKTAKVFADRSRSGQVLSNLISNAIKYSPASPSINVKASNDTTHVVFSVQDFGIGIERNLQDKIFERFFRVSEHAGNRVSGLGLGLFISSQIVRQQGGKIWVESEAGKGSEFHFSLPATEEKK